MGPFGIIYVFKMEDGGRKRESEGSVTVGDVKGEGANSLVLSLKLEESGHESMKVSNL